MKPFRMCGLPGAVCSHDGVHIATDRAKSQQRYLMTWKEGYPTWAYDCAVPHDKQFLEVCGPFRGATNAKTMVRDSSLVKRSKEDPLLAGHQYTLMTGMVAPEDKRVMTGVNGINDGGYHPWPMTITGPKPDDVPTHVLGQFGRVCESVRKDSERTFGIGKKRVRCLRLPFLIYKETMWTMSFAHVVFYTTCCCNTTDSTLLVNLMMTTR